VVERVTALHKYWLEYGVVEEEKAECFAWRLFSSFNTTVSISKSYNQIEDALQCLLSLDVDFWFNVNGHPMLNYLLETLLQIIDDPWLPLRAVRLVIMVFQSMLLSLGEQQIDIILKRLTKLHQFTDKEMILVLCGTYGTLFESPSLVTWLLQQHNVLIIITEFMMEKLQDKDEDIALYVKAFWSLAADVGLMDHFRELYF